MAAISHLRSNYIVPWLQDTVYRCFGVLIRCIEYGIVNKKSIKRPQIGEENRLRSMFILLLMDY